MLLKSGRVLRARYDFQRMIPTIWNTVSFACAVLDRVSFLQKTVYVTSLTAFHPDRSKHQVLLAKTTHLIDCDVAHYKMLSWKVLRKSLGADRSATQLTIDTTYRSAIEQQSF